MSCNTECCCCGKIHKFYDPIGPHPTFEQEGEEFFRISQQIEDDLILYRELLDSAYFSIYYAGTANSNGEWPDDRSFFEYKFPNLQYYEEFYVIREYYSNGNQCVKAGYYEWLRGRNQANYDFPWNRPYGIY